MKVGIGKVANAMLNALILVTIGYVMLRDGGPVRAWYSERSDGLAVAESLAQDWERLSAGGSLVSGSAAAELVEFGDYQCEFCKLAEDTVAALLTSRPRTSIRYRHLPLPQHPQAERAARVAVCAEEQAAFKRVHSALYRVHDWREGWERRVAQEAGVPDVSRLLRCLSQPRISARLDEDREFASKLGISGTPAWVGRNAIANGVVSVSRLRGLASGSNEPR